MDDLIYNQHDIPKEQWRYGLRSSAATGCGWISVYNALGLMGYRADPEALITWFEKKAPLVGGNLGTLFFLPALRLKKWGFPVTTLRRREDFDQAAREADVSILFYRWAKKWKYGAHFITVKATDEGFLGYNVYRNSTGANHLGKSLDQFLARRKYFGAVLFAVKKKD